MFFYFIISTNNRSHLKKKRVMKRTERNHNKQAKEISPPIQYHYTSVRNNTCPQISGFNGFNATVEVAEKAPPCMLEKSKK